jgi:hypothetical protein
MPGTVLYTRDTPEVAAWNNQQDCKRILQYLDELLSIYLINIKSEIADITQILGVSIESNMTEITVEPDKDKIYRKMPQKWSQMERNETIPSAVFTRAWLDEQAKKKKQDALRRQQYGQPVQKSESDPSYNGNTPDLSFMTNADLDAEGTVVMILAIPAAILLGGGFYLGAREIGKRVQGDFHLSDRLKTLLKLQNLIEILDKEIQSGETPDNILKKVYNLIHPLLKQEQGQEMQLEMQLDKGVEAGLIPPSQIIRDLAFLIDTWSEDPPAYADFGLSKDDNKFSAYNDVQQDQKVLLTRIITAKPRHMAWDIVSNLERLGLILQQRELVSNKHSPATNESEYMSTRSIHIEDIQTKSGLIDQLLVYAAKLEAKPLVSTESKSSMVRFSKPVRVNDEQRGMLLNILLVKLAAYELLGGDLEELMATKVITDQTEPQNITDADAFLTYYRTIRKYEKQQPDQRLQQPHIDKFKGYAEEGLPLAANKDNILTIFQDLSGKLDQKISDQKRTADPNSLEKKVTNDDYKLLNLFLQNGYVDYSERERSQPEFGYQLQQKVIEQTRDADRRRVGPVKQ